MTEISDHVMNQLHDFGTLECPPNIEHQKIPFCVEFTILKGGKQPTAIADTLFYANLPKGAYYLDEFHCSITGKPERLNYRYTCVARVSLD